MDAQLNHFLSDVHALDCDRAVGNCFITYLQSLGLDGSNIWFAPVTEDDVIARNASVSSYTDAVIEFMYEDGVKFEMTTLIEESYTPVRYGWDINKDRFEKGSDDYEFTRLAFEEIGFRNAIAFSVPTVGREGASGLSVFSSLRKSEFDTLMSTHLSDICMAGSMAHIRMQALSSATPHSDRPLSLRERECLLWLANGLRVKEIAYKLQISEVTVNMHLTNARKKLDAKTRECAIAKALTSGQISL